MQDTPYRSTDPYDEQVRCLAIANSDDADPGFVGHRLRHHGYALTEGHRERPGDWPDLTGIDLVLLLGSEWSVYWDSVASSVRAESALLGDAAMRGVPILGICFGAQMVSHAFGGSVTRSDSPEVGWFEIESDVPDVISPGPWLQWHYDVFAVPGDFTCLARSSVGPQAVRRGRILATQFHPEATESIVARWSSGGGADELARLGTSRENLLEESRRLVNDSRPASDRLIDWFVDVVAPS
jgi:GMP synthase-like glutamine amidotransferase